MQRFPKGWYAAETIAEHTRLDGKFPIGRPKTSEPGAPDWPPDENAWLLYRATLYRVADGVGKNDPACVELAIRYIELRYIGSYSGFIRSLLSRGLKHATLIVSQTQRLHDHFLTLVLRGERTEEFRQYLTLWRHISYQEATLGSLAKSDAHVG